MSTTVNRNKKKTNRDTKHIIECTPRIIREKNPLTRQFRAHASLPIRHENSSDYYEGTACPLLYDLSLLRTQETNNAARGSEQEEKDHRTFRSQHNEAVMTLP